MSSFPSIGIFPYWPVYNGPFGHSPHYSSSFYSNHAWNFPRGIYSGPVVCPRGPNLCFPSLTLDVSRSHNLPYGFVNPMAPLAQSNLAQLQAMPQQQQATMPGALQPQAYHDLHVGNHNPSRFLNSGIQNPAPDIYPPPGLQHQVPGIYSLTHSDHGEVYEAAPGKFISNSEAIHSYQPQVGHSQLAMHELTLPLAEHFQQSVVDNIGSEAHVSDVDTSIAQCITTISSARNIDMPLHMVNDDRRDENGSYLKNCQNSEKLKQLEIHGTIRKYEKEENHTASGSKVDYFGKFNVENLAAQPNFPNNFPNRYAKHSKK